MAHKKFNRNNRHEMDHDMSLESCTNTFNRSDYLKF